MCLALNMACEYKKKIKGQKSLSELIGVFKSLQRCVCNIELVESDSVTCGEL